ncbi:ECF-type sigma factor [Terriglobus sp. TAA 43]|uniref:ECF-type sigma factor n=1 Tax=Terriglobus sp. TAA 43 TaxID=278961 RepID=UPI0006456ACA|nr:ECF-type sigma factor [Terriglobus sp. TAA 43]
MDSGQSEITQVLRCLSKGDDRAHERLMPLVYVELRRIAAAHMRRERADNSLQPTALVHEAYLKLVGMERIHYSDRAHFFAVSSRLMRQILLDKARRDRADKRDRGLTLILADDDMLAAKQRPVDLIALDDALLDLVKLDERKAKIVEMRFFGGLSEEEIGCVLQISSRTVKRDWRAARAWLYNALAHS